MTHIIAISAITDGQGFDSALKQAYARLPKDARWTLAVASTDGTRALNVIVHESVESVSSFLEEHVGPYATTDYYEADTANAVGFPK
ncbi:hypothetical protein [Flindersiella endophytica]